MIGPANYLVFPLASWLMTYFIQSTLFLAAALLGTRFCFRHSARMRKQVLLTAMLAPLLTATLCQWREAAPVKYHTSGPSSQIHAVPLTSATLADWFTAEEIDLSVPVHLQGNDHRTVVLNRSDMNRFLWCSGFLVLWLLVVLMGGRRFLIRWQAFRKSLTGRKMIQNSPLSTTLEDLCTSAGIKRRIGLTTSTGIRQVTAMGFSEICIPSDHMPELEKDEVKNVLAHELMHLKSLDPILMITAGLIQIFLFFQPLNRVAARKLQEESEYIADEGALALTRKPDILAGSLLKLARAGQRRLMSSLAPNFSGNRPILAVRTRKILAWNHELPSKYSFLQGMIPLVLIFVFVAWVYPDDVMEIHRFWNGKSFNPPDLLADQSWYDRRQIKLIRPNGDRLNFKLSHVYIDARSDQVCQAPFGSSALTLEKITRKGNVRIEIKGDEEGLCRRLFHVNGCSKVYDENAASLLRDALLVMIDND